MSYYYAREGRQFGPHTEDEILAMVGNGSLRAHELIWREGMADWAPVHAVFKSVPPPPPAGYPMPPPHHPPSVLQPVYGIAPSKQRVAYVLLGVFLGCLGIHNFYAGYTNRAVAQLLVTLLAGWLVFPIVAVAIWALVEVITVTRDARGVSFG